MDFDRNAYTNMFKTALAENRIKKSQETFKIKLFLTKAENSLLIAKHVKEINPTKDQPPKLHWNYWAITVSYYSMLYCAKALILTKGYEVHDHDAAEVALGYLCIPTQIEKEDLEIYKKMISKRTGLILVTGPTGSGKTTTLYTTLATLNAKDVNIMTTEDPIEYQLPGINQIQVNQKAGLTFARSLRAILRQDPDIIMVGEIRDLETAEIAIQASLTGHLVFSTLHTNDSAGAVTRLIDMGIEPFLVSSSVVAIAAQRLVRLLCPSCKKEYTPAGPELDELRIEPSQLYGHQVYMAVGCDKCMQTGYRGRTGIYEILLVNDEIRGLIQQNVNSQIIKNRAIEGGMATLRKDGAEKVVAGLTSIEEVSRVTQEDIVE